MRANRRFLLKKIAKKRIEESLERMGANYGYSSAACGTDILFLETMIERRGNPYLPFSKDEFIGDKCTKSRGLDIQIGKCFGSRYFCTLCYLS